MWTLEFFLSSLLLGVGLSVDAFCVCVANGMNEPTAKFGRVTVPAAVFGAFQAVMPLLGWIFVHTIINYFKIFEHFIPWIALSLLGYIGGKMLYDGIKNKDSDEKPALTLGAIFIQGVATSIDALSVGFTIAEYDFIVAFASVLIIGVTTYALSVLGFYVGTKFGDAVNKKATLTGGIILIAIGIEIFIKGMISLYA